MTDSPTENANQNPVGVQLQETQYSVVPGNRVTIPVTLMNQGGEEDHFELSARGIPLDWVSIPTPVVLLRAGEKKEVTVVIEAPPASQIQAGQYPVTLQVLSQSSPAQRVEAEFNLTVAAFEVKGRIGILMESIQFSVAPGSSATIPVGSFAASLGASRPRRLLKVPRSHHRFPPAPDETLYPIVFQQFALVAILHMA